jgi:AhpD family alkylhydroperoxidase
MRPLRSRPVLAGGLAAFEVSTLLSNQLDPAIKTLAHLRVSSIIGCPYCLDLGSELAKRAGVTEAQLMDLHRYNESEAFSADERLVLDLASALTVTPVQLDGRLMDDVRLRFSEAELAELVTAIAWENHLARWNRAFGVPSAGFTEGVCALPASRASQLESGPPR